MTKYHGQRGMHFGAGSRSYTLPDEVNEFDLEELLYLRDNLSIHTEYLMHPNDIGRKFGHSGIKSAEEYVEAHRLNPAGKKMTRNYVNKLVCELRESIGEVDRLLEEIYRKNRERDGVPEKPHPQNSSVVSRS